MFTIPMVKTVLYYVMSYVRPYKSIHNRYLYKETIQLNYMQNFIYYNILCIYIYHLF